MLTMLTVAIADFNNVEFWTLGRRATFFVFPQVWNTKNNAIQLYWPLDDLEISDGNGGHDGENLQGFN